MKIIFPIGSIYPAQLGGPSNTIYWLAKALIQNKVEVSVIATNSGIPPEVKLDKWQDTAFGQVIYVNSWFHAMPFRHILISLSFLFRKNLLHLTGLFYPPSTIIGLLAALFRRPLIWSVRGELSPNALKYSSAKKRVVLRLIELLKKQITFHSTSIEETALIKKRFGKAVKIIQIPNFLELRPKIAREEQPAPYLLFLGRIHPIKAIDNLLHAIQQSKHFKPKGVKLKIAGDFDNSYGKTLQQLVSELKLDAEVQFIGRIDGQQKETILAHAAALILPSHSENFGNVVVEALAQGTPVIASQGTPWQILEQYRAGFWSKNDPTNLAKNIDQLFSLDKEQYLTYRENAFHLVKSEFDVFRGVDRWIAAYKKTLSER